MHRSPGKSYDNKMTPNFCLHVWWPSGCKEEQMVMLLMKVDSLWPSDSTGSSDSEGGGKYKTQEKRSHKNKQRRKPPKTHSKTFQYNAT